jgi:hypothetical protein
MSADFRLTAGDLLPPLEATLSDDNGPADLTGATVEIVYRCGDTVITGECTVVSAEDGTIQYEWAEGDTDTPGMYAAKFVVTFASGKKQSFPNDSSCSIEIRGGLA